MRKSILMISVVLMLLACGGQTKNEASDADSTQVFEVPDTLNTVEAVVKQVNAVYDYWNELREHFDEKKPSVDERFGTKEWQQVREDAWAADKDCECGGFFDFGDEGPLDPWTYDCYEGYVSANDIEAKILENGTADVKFLVKDAVTTKGIPMRWLMRVEDGEWRVANIIFEKDGGIDLLESLRNYGGSSRPINSSTFLSGTMSWWSWPNPCSPAMIPLNSTNMPLSMLTVMAKLSCICVMPKVTMRLSSRLMTKILMSSLMPTFAVLSPSLRMPSSRAEVAELVAT